MFVKRKNRNGNERGGWSRLPLLAVLLLAALPYTVVRAACINPPGASGTLFYNTDHNVPQYCNNTNWISLAPMDTIFEGVDFDGTDSLTRTDQLLGVTDSKRWTVSYWMKTNGIPAGTELLDSLQAGGNGDFSLVAKDAANRIRFDAENSAGTDIMLLRTNNNYDNNVWHHVLFSVDLAAGVSAGHLYIDDVSDIDTGARIFTNDTMDFTPGGAVALKLIADSFSGSIADLWIDFGTYIDFSVAANRRKFITENKGPAFLGLSGEAPTGTPPDMFFSGNNSNFFINRGTGGDFTVSGTWTTSATTPVPQGPNNLTKPGHVTDAAQMNNPVGLAVRGNYAYVAADDSDGLAVVNISNPAAPSIVTLLTDAVLTDIGRVALRGNYVFATGAGNDRLVAIDVSNPAAPAIVSSIAHATYLDQALDIEIQDNFAFIGAAASDTFTVVDISDPTSMIIVGNVTDATMDLPIDIKVRGNYAYVVAENSDRFIVIDISNPYDPTIVGNITHANLDRAVAVELYGNYAFVSAMDLDRITTVDISNPAAPSVVGGLLDATNLDGPRLMDIEGNYLYVAAYDGDSLTVLDISNPVAPVYVTKYTNATQLNQAWAVKVYGDKAYVTARIADTFSVIDLNWGCVNPIGVEGQIQYSIDKNVPIYCDGSSWTQMAPEWPTTKGLVGWWKLDETSGTFADSSGKGNTGTQSGGIEYASAGVIGKAAGFDGANDYITAGNAAYFDFEYTHPFTIAAWVYRDTNGAEHDILEKYNGTGYGLWFPNGTDDLSLFLRGSLGNTLEIRTPVSTGQWHHVVGTYDGSSTIGGLKLYVDGVLDGSPTVWINNPPVGGETLLNNQQVTIGNEQPGTTCCVFDGRIDDVRVYNRILSAAEVTDLYNYGVKQGFLTDTSLVAYWPFDEDGGKMAVDMVGNNIAFASGGVLFHSTGGQIGGAVELTGSAADILSTKGDTRLDNLSPLTIAAWIYPHTVATSGMIYSTDSAAAGDGYAFLVNTNRGLHFDVDTAVNPNLRHTSANNVVNLNQWQHVAVSWPGTTSAADARIYVNGAEVGSYSLTTDSGGAAFNDAANEKFIGRFASGNVFDGLIDDLRIYNRALSATEIDRIYDAGVAGMVAQDCASPDAAEGTIIYNTDENAIQYCNGANWVVLGK